MAEDILSPNGTIIVEVRSDDAVMTILGGEEKRVTGYRPQRPPPHVVVIRASHTPRPFGAGSGRLGVLGYLYEARCVAAKAQDGDIRATQLANAVANCLQRGPRTRSTGDGVVGIFQSSVNQIGPVLEDPDTGDPFVVVTFTAAVSARALT